jgi:periplasmic copper chaperone A
MIRSCLLLILLALVPAGLAWAAGGGVKVESGWARATPAGATVGVAYVTITNKGKTSDRLIGASAPVAGRAELHVNLRDGDVVQMRAVSAVEINPGDLIEFKPNGLHVMLVDLSQPLKEGDHFPITLTFEQAGPLQTDVVVAAAGAKTRP